MPTAVAAAVEIVPASAVIGAEVRGVDLAQDLDDATFRTIEDAYYRHSVLVFRGQHLTPEQQIRFSRRFGPLEIHVLAKYLLPGHPEVLVVSNILDDQGRNIGLPDAGQTWHTDTSYREQPSKGSVLYALEIPVKDGKALGDTLFAGTAPAYEALPADLKRRLDGRKAIHRYSQRKRPPGSARAKLSKDLVDQTPDVAHPVVRTHPVTGRKALYVFEGECVGIEGLPEDEGLALISELTEHCIRPEFIYRHHWQAGDVIMWDNAATLHLAIADYALPLRRLMHRVTIDGGVPH